MNIEPEVPQIYYPHCGRFHTYRPAFVHPTMGFTWSLMHFVSSLLMYAPARWIARQYSISYSAVLRIDRANAYRQAALKHLPDVKVCFDAFHLVSNMNDVVDKVRRAEFAHPTEAQRKRLAGRRYILLKAQESLSEKERIDLDALCALNQQLTKTYILKEQFRSIFSHLTEHEAMWQLSHRISMAVSSGIRQVERLARGIAERYNEVINGIRYNINSASIESTNAGIKRMQSKCCGLFDIDYLFMKLRQRHLSREDSSPRRA